jgi:hypothetical protein
LTKEEEEDLAGEITNDYIKKNERIHYVEVLVLFDDATYYWGYTSYNR